jgi:hypothetical protein
VTRKFARLALVAVLVASIFAVAATGTVAAYEDYGSCVDDRGAGWTLSCFVSHDSLQPLDGGDEIDSQQDAYYDMSALEDAAEASATTASNNVGETRTMAYRIWESEFARAMANGSDKSTASQKAQNAVGEYVAGKLETMANENNQFVNDLWETHNQSGVTVVTVAGANPQNIRYQNVTVFSGEDYQRSFNVSYVYDGTNDISWTATPSTVNNADSMSVQYSSENINDRTITTNITGYESAWSDIKSVVSEVNSESNAFAQNISSDQYENLSPSDIPSPLTQATEFGQDFNDTGSSGYASALLASHGFSVPENVSTTYEVCLYGSSDVAPSYNETCQNTYDGALFGDFPNDEINTGTVYDGSGSAVWLVSDALSDRKKEIDGYFSVRSIELQNGNVTNSTGMNDYSYQSLNASEPLLSYQQYQDLLNRTEHLEGGAAGGGLLGGNSLLILLPLAGAALFLYAREQDDDGNGGGGTTINMS